MRQAIFVFGARQHSVEYQSLMLELDRSPIDDENVLKYVNSALLAENQVKKEASRHAGGAEELAHGRADRPP